MTTQETIESIREQLGEANERIGSLREQLREAKIIAFRERTGFNQGDWVLFDGSPAIIAAVELGHNPDYDWMTVRPLTKAGTISQRPKDLYSRWRGPISPWPADRPLPEVKA